MDFYGLDRSKALAHFDGVPLGRAGRDTDTVRAWNRLRPENLLDLLDTAAPEARRDARTLAAQLTRSAWRVNLQAPSQGKANQLVSNAREVSLTSGGRECRLQLSEGTRLQLERISQAG